MKPTRVRPWRMVPLAAALLLAACGGGDDDLPQLDPAVGATLQGNCADLPGRLTGLANTTVTASESVAAGTVVGGASVPAHCRVTGESYARVSPVDGNTYQIRWEMRLPLDWNGRFLHQGNGGLDGNVNAALGGAGASMPALARGFAVFSSDAGHPGSMGASFGVDPQARLDYGYQAVGKMTPIAKDIIAAAYDKGPDRSYFSGCSNGGRHAMVAATRYFEDYDGILAGAPGYNLPKAAVANIAGGQLYASVATGDVTTPAGLGTAFTPQERATLGAAVLAKCDALDGLADGIVQDTTACQAAFKLQTDVPTCAGARDGTCLSAAQKSAIGQIFAGPTTSDGRRIYASFPYDPGIVGGGIPFWEFTAPLFLDSGAVGLVFGVPPEDPATFNGPSFMLNADLDDLVRRINATNATYTESAMSFMTPPNPADMSGLKLRGGKIMVYHGVSDPIFSVDDSEAWFKALQAKNFNDNAETFARLYRIPGMGHCSGGPATDQFDMLSALVAWVEQGEAPGRIVATARGGANADVPASWSPSRTRPLCPYPQVARYRGTGNPESAASFVCTE